MNHTIKDSIEELEQIKENIGEHIKDNTCIETTAFNPEFNIERKLINDIDSIIHQETYQRLIR